MKTSLFLLLGLSSFVPIFSGLYATDVDDFFQGCPKNLYNQGLNTDIVLYNKEYLSILNRTLGLTSGYTGTVYTECLFPIYHPRLSRINLIQSVIYGKEDGKYFSMPSSSLSQIKTKKAGPFSLTGFGKPHHGPERMNAFRSSMREPFLSAYQVQFYVYRRDILLVARNADGLVTHFFYEKLNDPPQKSDIERWLGKKWYQP